MTPKKEVILTNEQISFRLAVWLEGGPAQQRIIWLALERSHRLRAAILRLVELLKLDVEVHHEIKPA